MGDLRTSEKTAPWLRIPSAVSESFLSLRDLVEPVGSAFFEGQADRSLGSGFRMFWGLVFRI